MKNFRISRVIYVCVFFLLLFPAASPVLAPQATTPASDIIDLPAAAQGAISAAIGSDDPNYHFNMVSSLADGTNTWQTAHDLHGFNSDLSAQGAVIDTGADRLMLSLSAYGCGADLRQAGKAVLQASANRIQYVREEVTEWYVNGPFGLEHGFPAHPRGVIRWESIPIP